MLDFTPYLDWINVPDPKNPPPGAKEVTAEDLLRYEQALAAIAQEAADGLVGDSAYEVAVEEGFVGAKAEWLDSLKGLDGVNAVENALAVASYIENLTSPVRKALNATYATKDYANTLAYGTNLEASDAVVSSWVTNSDSETGAALAAQYAGLDVLDLSRLGEVAAADRNKSIGASRIAFEDAESLVETWADLADWGSTGVQVSDGKVYQSTTNWCGANHAFVIPPNGRLRVRGSITMPSDSTLNSGIILIGVDQGDPGAVPANGGSDMFAIGFDEDQAPIVWDKAAGGPGIVALGSAVVPGTYWVTVTVDESNISLTLTDEGGLEWQISRPRSSMPIINNVTVWNSDTRGLAGASINRLGARAGSVTVAPRAGIEGSAPSAIYLPDDAGQQVHIGLPFDYDSRTQSPLVIYCHGHGDTELLTVDGTGPRRLYDALTKSGYIVASSFQHGNNWGNDDGIEDIVRLYRYVRDHYAVGPVLLIGHSMGGLSSLLALAGRKLPGVVGWAGVYPVTNLDALYQAGQYDAAIDAAYGLDGTGVDYDAKTDGHDPMLLPPAAFRAMPLRFYASPDDVTVTKEANSDAFASLVAPLTPESDVIDCTGPHGDLSHFQTEDLVSFFDRCISG